MWHVRTLLFSCVYRSQSKVRVRLINATAHIVKKTNLVSLVSEKKQSDIYNTINIFENIIFIRLF